MESKYHDEDHDDIEKSESTPMKQTVLNNQSNELFDDESHIVHKLINVKRVGLPRNGESWEILEDDRVVFTLKGVRLTNKEKALLRTVEGIQILMNEYKSGNKSVAGIRRKLKEKCL
jgi:hypothetical protein